MLVNTILKLTLAPFRTVLMVVAPISACVIGISFAIPFWQSIFRFLMAVMWLPFLCYITATSRLYQRVVVLRPILAVISIPLLLALDIFVAIMPGSHRTDKFDKASMKGSWPFSSWSNGSDVSSKEIRFKPFLLGNNTISANGKQHSYHTNRSLTNTGKVSTCFLCGDMIKNDWEKCPRCNEPLQVPQSLPSVKYERLVPVNGKQHSYQVDKSLHTSAKISTCKLCGDMVRADWERCPRCDEPLEGLLRLPALWYRKTVPVERKVYQLSR